MFYYISFANHFGLEYGVLNFDNFHQFDVIISIEDLAENGHRLNLTARHNPFKEPYRTIWIENLS